MDGILFVVFWLSGAVLHTLYDLKIKQLFKQENSLKQPR